MNHGLGAVEKSLILEFQSGNAEAFSQIYARFRKPIFRYISQRITDQQIAEEVTQDIFLKAYRFRMNYSPEYAFSTWLWSISKNTVSDFLRRKTNNPAKDPSLFGESLHPDDLPCPAPNAESLMIKKGIRRNLVLKMKSLTRLQKRVLWLRGVHDFSDAQISHKLGLTLPAIKNLAYRAKLKIISSFRSLKSRS